MKEGFIPQNQRKKILLLSDDVRMNSGISTMAREIVLGTAHHFNWINLGAAINHPEASKVLDVSGDTNNIAGITDASVIIYPNNGYGTPEVIRQLMDMHKPDAIMFFTDPRYWIWLFQIENEIRRKIPLIYINIWDNLPAPLYNKPYYESCDSLLAISKQTYNINKMVLGDKAKDKVITYVPHGIDEKSFFPINEFMKEHQERLEEKRKQVFGDNIPEFVVFYNARNIRRKSTSDLIAAYVEFCNSIGKDKAKKTALLLHTQAMDENGTDLNAVIEAIADPSIHRIVINDERLSTDQMNLLYNMCDVTALISSNEGWGLSLTEAMMAGKMIIANTTGGMQDQMRFEDENGKWIEFSEEFPSNHFGRYRKHGEWAVPVFPSNISILGSIPTPYIYDDRCSFKDVAIAIEQVYSLDAQERNHRGLSAREWVTSDEAMMSARWMCKNVITNVDTTLQSWKPRKNFELLKVEELPRKKVPHTLTY